MNNQELDLKDFKVAKAEDRVIAFEIGKDIYEYDVENEVFYANGEQILSLETNVDVLRQDKEMIFNNFKNIKLKSETRAVPVDDPMVLSIWVFCTGTIKTYIFIKFKNSCDTSLLVHLKALILLNLVKIPIG